MGMVPYEFKCVNKDCKGFQDVYIEVLDRDGEHKSKCPECGKKAQRVFSLISYQVDFTPGFDYGLGRYIDTKAERENYIAEKGIRKLGC